MLIKFADVLQGSGPVHLHERMDIAPLLKDYKEILSAEPLNVDVQAKNMAGVIDVQGLLRTEMKLVCSRCLTHFVERLNLPFHEVFSPVEKKGEFAEEGENGEEIHYVGDDKVDLKPYVEETLLLGIPYIPLCKEACKGLCPICGRDRNVEECGCKQERIDPRWADLEDFFKS